MKPNYIVRIDGEVVETWAIARLPFEPKGWLREWREELKAALRGQGDTAGGFLAAVYGSPDRYACDAENVLFYNVGGVFSTSTRGGLRFERVFTAPACPEELDGPADHYHRYQAGEPGGPFGGWRETGVVAELPEVELPRMRPESNPAGIWLPLRQALIDEPTQLPDGASFSLRIRLECTVDVPIAAAASLVKPLFDGVVSALHTHDGWRSAEIAAWMNARFGFDTAAVAALLAARSPGLLGTRRLFRARAGGYQWAPDDDRCVAGELEILRSANGRARLSGTVHTISESEWRRR